MRICASRECILPAVRGFRFCAGPMCAINKRNRQDKDGEEE